MNIELFKEGCLIMFIGMGTVFAFLTIMIYAIQIMTKIIKVINKFSPEVLPEAKVVKKKSNDDTEVAIAIACAMKERGKAC